MKKPWLIFFLIFSISLFAQNHKVDIVQNWSVDIGSNHGTAPVFYPSDYDANSIVVGGEDGRIHRIGPDGKEMFVYAMDNHTLCSPAVGDLDGDGKAEIISADDKGIVHCINVDGKQTWQYATEGRIDYTIAIADVDNDSKKEVIATTKNGWVTCLSHNGKLRWKFMAEPQSGPVAVGDINHDNIPEIVFGTDLGKIYCIDANGKYLWHTEIDGHFGRSLPLIADPDNDGHMEVLITRSEVCSNAAILAINGLTGKLLWEGRTTLHGYGPLAVADIDGDGSSEIFVVDKASTIYSFSPNGKRNWVNEFEGHGIFFPPAIADLDGDNDMELISGIRRENKVFFLDHLGNEIQTFALSGGANSAPTVADLDRDGRLEIYMVTQNPGKIIQLEVKGQKSGKVLWASWRGDAQRTGYVPSHDGKMKKSLFPSDKKIKVIDAGKLRALLGENHVTLNHGQVNGKLILQTSLTDASGATITTLDFIEKEKQEITAKFALLHAGHHTLDLILLNKTTGRKLLQMRYKVDATGFTADLELIKNNIEKLNEWYNDLGKGHFGDKELIEEIINSMITRENALERDAMIFPEMNDKEQETYANYAQVKRAEYEKNMHFARFLIIQRKAGDRTPFVCWEDPNPWDETLPEEIYPQKYTRDKKLEVLALGNEYESRAIYMTNLTTKTLYIKIMPVEWSRNGQKLIGNKHILQLREVMPTGTDKGDIVHDALPLLNEGAVVVVPPMENRQLWFTFDTHELKAGNYIGEMELLALGMNDPVIKLSLNLKVSSVSLPEKSIFHFYTWAHMGKDPDEPMNKKKFDDLLAHGTTVFKVSAPLQHFDSEGNLTGEPDWTYHDKWMTKYHGNGIVLVSSFQNSIVGPKETPIWSRIWQKAYQSALMRYIGHLKKLGFAYKEFALYPYDEPWLTGMSVANKLIKVAKLSKEADPEVQIYCDPTGMASPENSLEAVPYIDIWMPMIDLLKKDKRLLEFYKNTGAQVWTYEAPGHARMLKPLGLYRMQPWLAFYYGLTGSGIWTYDYGNIWYTDQSAWVGVTYSLVYEDGKSVVPSRRWEAYRDGVEDYNMLTMLKEKGDEETKVLLNDILLKITNKQEDATSISRLVIDYDTDYELLMKYRKEIIENLEVLYK